MSANNFSYVVSPVSAGSPNFEFPDHLEGKWKERNDRQLRYVFILVVNYQLLLISSQLNMLLLLLLFN